MENGLVLYPGKITPEASNYYSNLILTQFLINRERLIVAKTLSNLRQFTLNYNFSNLEIKNGNIDDFIFEGIEYRDREEIIKGNENYTVSSYTSSKFATNIRKMLPPNCLEKKKFFIEAGRYSIKNSELNKYAHLSGKGIENLTQILAGGNAKFNHTKFFKINHKKLENKLHQTTIEVNHIPETQVEEEIYWFNIGHYLEMLEESDDTIISYEYGKEKNKFKFKINYTKKPEILEQNILKKASSVLIKYAISGILKTNEIKASRAQKKTLQTTKEQIILTRETYRQLYENEIPLENDIRTTARHTATTTKLLTTFLKALKAEPKSLALSEFGMSVHDIGKLYINPDILNKKGKLTPDEILLIKPFHTLMGHYYLRNIKKFPKEATDLAGFHHINNNYPYDLCLEDISFLALASQPVDIAEALLNIRVYKPALDFNETVKILKNSNLHPLIGEIFIEQFLPQIEEYHFYNDRFSYEKQDDIKNFNLKEYQEYMEKIQSKFTGMSKDFEDFLRGNNQMFKLNPSSDLKTFMRTHKPPILDDKVVNNMVIESLAKLYDNLSEDESKRIFLESIPFRKLKKDIEVVTKEGISKNLEQILIDFKKSNDYCVL